MQRAEAENQKLVNDMINENQIMLDEKDKIETDLKDANEDLEKSKSQAEQDAQTIFDLKTQINGLNKKAKEDSDAMTSLQTKYDQVLQSHADEINKLREESTRLSAEHELALKKCEADLAKTSEAVEDAEGMKKFLEKKVSLCEDDKKKLEEVIAAKENET